VETDRGVRITKRVEERDAIVDEALEADDVSVERIAIDRPVSQTTGVRYEGDRIAEPAFRGMGS
jgi:hypothetical protein